MLESDDVRPSDRQNRHRRRHGTSQLGARVRRSIVDDFLQMGYCTLESRLVLRSVEIQPSSDDLPRNEQTLFAMRKLSRSGQPLPPRAFSVTPTKHTSCQPVLHWNALGKSTAGRQPPSDTIPHGLCRCLHVLALFRLLIDCYAMRISGLIDFRHSAAALPLSAPVAERRATPTPPVPSRHHQRNQPTHNLPLSHHHQHHQHHSPTIRSHAWLLFSTIHCMPTASPASTLPSQPLPVLLPPPSMLPAATAPPSAALRCDPLSMPGRPSRPLRTRITAA